jgi:hypothetical protein
MFGGGRHRCDARVTGEGLVVGRCGCAGYTAAEESFGESVEIVEAVELRLRRPGEDVSPAPMLGPVRDIFDEARRLRGPDESVPWRPPR